MAPEHFRQQAVAIPHLPPIAAVAPEKRLSSLKLLHLAPKVIVHLSFMAGINQVPCLVHVGVVAQHPAGQLDHERGFLR